MAKDKKKSDGADKKAKKVKRSGEGKKSKRASAAVADEPKVAKVVRSAKRKAADLASNPAVAEVVAATLVAAAALRNPQKARALAASAREELTEAGKAGAEQGGALWQLALDVARRSLDSLGNEGSAKPKGKTKRKSDG